MRLLIVQTGTQQVARQKWALWPQPSVGRQKASPYSDRESQEAGEPSELMQLSRQRRETGFRGGEDPEDQKLSDQELGCWTQSQGTLHPLALGFEMGAGQTVFGESR